MKTVYPLQTKFAGGIINIIWVLFFFYLAMGLVSRKSVFVVCDHVRFNEANSATQSSSYSKTCVCLFVLFDSLRPINNLSVKQGRVFLG